jgi:hypothetical protein
MTERNLTPEIASASVRRQMNALDDDRLLTFEEVADEGVAKGDHNGALSALPFSQAQ